MAGGVAVPSEDIEAQIQETQQQQAQADGVPSQDSKPQIQETQQQQAEAVGAYSQDAKAQIDLANKLKKLDEQEIEAAEKILKREIDIQVRRKMRLQKRPFWRLPGKKAQSVRRSESEVRRDVESELGKPHLPDSYEEIKRLLWVEGEVVHKRALLHWGEREKRIREFRGTMVNKMAKVKNEVYQLIGFFSVFQGVVLTAVSQSSLLHCNNLWSPVFLSLLASCVTMAAVTQKLARIAYFQKATISTNLSIQKVSRRLLKLQSEGEIFRFVEPSWIPYRGKKPPYSVVVILALGLFTVAFPLSYWRILCHPGHSP